MQPRLGTVGFQREGTFSYRGDPVEAAGVRGAVLGWRGWDGVGREIPSFVIQRPQRCWYRQELVAQESSGHLLAPREIWRKTWVPATFLPVVQP